MSTAVEACFDQMHRAGWSVGAVRLLTARGPLWPVTGTNRGHALRAQGRKQSEAWQNACELAESVGLLPENG